MFKSENVEFFGMNAFVDYIETLCSIVHRIFVEMIL